jgi:tape measure domain-containing protein
MAGSVSLGEMWVAYRAKTEDLVRGMNTAKSSMSSADKTAQQTGKNISDSFSQAGQSVANFASKTVTQIDTAKAKIVLIESEVEKARKKIKELENAADAGKSVTGLNEARAKLTLLEGEAQKARGGLQKLERQENEAGQAAHNLASKTNEAASSIGSRLAGAFSATQNLASRANDASASIGSRLTGALRGAGGGLLDFTSKLSMTAMGLQSLYNGAISLGKAILAPNAAMEQTAVSFKTLLHSGEAASKMMKDLQKFAATTPFEFPEIASSAKRMLAFGFSADSILPMLNSVGDAVSALGGGAFEIDRVTTALGQMKAKGKVSAEEMMQLAEVGIPAWDLLAKGLGVTTAEAMKLGERGLIPAGKAVDILTTGMGKAFGGGMQAQSQTFNGLLSTFKDNIAAAWRAFTGPLFEQAKGGLSTIGSLVSNPAFQNFATTMGEKVGGALEKVGNFLSTTFKPVFNDLKEALTDEPLGVFLANLGDVGRALGDAAFAVFNLWTNISPLGAIFKQSSNDGNIFAEMLYGSAEIMRNYVVPAINDLTTFINGLKPIVEPVGKFFLDVFKMVGDWLVQNGPSLKSIGEQIFSGIKTVVETVAPPIVNNLLPAIKDLLGAILPVLTRVIDWIDKSGILKVIFGIVAIALKDIIDKITMAVKVVTFIINAFMWWIDTTQKVNNAIRKAFGDIGKWLGDRFQEAKTKIAEIFGNIGKWFGDRVEDIKKAFSGIGQWFGSQFQDSKNKATDTWKPIGQWFGDRWNEIQEGTKPFREYMGAVFHTLWNIWVAIFGKLGKWFGDRLEEVKAVLAPIGQWFHDRWSEAWAGVTAFFGIIGQWFNDRWKEAQNVFIGIGAWFSDRFAEAWAGVTSFFGIIGQWFGDRWRDTQNVLAPVGQWFHDRFSEAWSGVTKFFGGIGQWFQDRWNEIMTNVGKFKDNMISKFGEVKTGVEGVFKGLVNAIIVQLNNGISSIEKFINFFGDGLNNIASKLGTTGNIPHVSLGRVPSYASGTGAHPGGPAIVGEQGPELVFLPRGAAVAPNGITEMFLSMGGMIPGYAGGIGDWGGQIWDWVAGGAKSVVEKMVGAMGIKAPDLAGMGNIAGGIFNKIKDWAVGWVDKILPKFDFSFGGGTSNVSESLKNWIAAAMTLTHVPGSWAGALATIAMHESGGNPNAQNNSDINAQRGDPSRGLFQTIMGTFMAYALPGYNTNIFDPIQNAAAAIRYIQARYGDVFHVPGIMALAAGRPYVGYANGGLISEPISGIGLRSGTSYAFGENGPEWVSPMGGNSNALLLAVLSALASARASNTSDEIHIHNHVEIDSHEIGYSVEKYQLAELRHGGGVRR